MECLGADTVLELVGGRLPHERIAKLAEHLDVCSACRRLVSATADAESIDAASAATEVDPSSASRLPRDPTALPVVPRDVYLRLDEIARGGLGRIVRAQDLRTGRMVAIKEMLADTPDAAARFVREAIVTANLQHPAIVPVYEVGRWPDDQAFYAMKLVTGRPLSAVIDAARDLDERLALIPHVIALADALAYAHGEAVIHRDLKPHNVLVGAHGETVVIDWGLARRLADSDPLATPIVRDGETVVGSVLGTPAYMAPEQARGERVDERADVYAIGAILYRALAGCTPYRATTSGELIEAVRRGPPPPLAELVPAAPRDLVAIVERAMAREPAARYRSANELVADLRRFTTGQLVRAHHYTARQRVQRFALRHRTAVIVAAVAGALLATVGVASIRRVVDARDMAQHELAAAYVDRGRVELASEHPDRALAFAAAAAELGATGADVRFIAARALDALPELRRFRATSAAFVPGTQDTIVASDTALARWRPETDQTLWSAPGARDVAILGPHELAVRRAAIDIVSADDGHTLATLPDSSAVRGGFVVDETRHWLAGTTAAGGVALYDLAARTRIATAGSQLDAVVLVAPDGEHLVAMRGRGLFASLAVVDRAGAQRPLCETCWLARSAGAQFVWIGIGRNDHDQRMGVADWAGKPVREIALAPGGGIAENLVIDPERGIAVVANSDGTLLQYILPTGDYRGARAVRDVPYAMAFERGNRVWVLGLHNSLTLFELTHGLELGRWRIGGQWLARSDDGTTLAIANGTEVSAWRVPSPQLEIVQPTADRPDLTAFADDGALLVASGRALAERDPRGAARVIAHHAAPIESLEPIAPNAILAASRDGEVAIWDRATGAAVLRLSGAGPRAAASPDGRAIATGDHGGHVVLWDRGTGRSIATLGVLPRAIVAIRWTRDGAQVGAIDETGGARIWDRAGALVRDLPGVAAPTWGGPAQTVLDEVLEAVGRTASSIDLAFSSDGRWLARACPGCAGLHELATGRTLPLVHGPEPGEPVLAVAFSHDGSRVLLAYGGTLRLWDTTTGIVTATIAANTRTLAARFSPDDRLVFTGGMDNRLRVWDAATGAEYTGFGLNSPIHQIAMSPDGARVAATSANALMLWTLSPLAQPPTRLRSLAACRTGLVVDAGRFAELPPSCGH
jgi:eukaryotic-like serine/threonine-protein kinase